MGDFATRNIELATYIIRRLRELKVTVCTMESCTSGALVSAMTDIPGASSVIHESYVTYSNQAKMKHGVPIDVINTYSVYSHNTALAMASACTRLPGEYQVIGIGVTGTLSNIDPYNEMCSTIGEVFYAIELDDWASHLIRGNKTRSSSSYKIEVPINLDRHSQKEFIVMHILESICSIIN